VNDAHKGLCYRWLSSVDGRSSLVGCSRHEHIAARTRGSSGARAWATGATSASRSLMVTVPSASMKNVICISFTAENAEYAEVPWLRAPARGGAERLDCCFLVGAPWLRAPARGGAVAAAARPWNEPPTGAGSYRCHGLRARGYSLALLCALRVLRGKPLTSTSAPPRGWCRPAAAPAGRRSSPVGRRCRRWCGRRSVG